MTHKMFSLSVFGMMLFFAVTAGAQIRQGGFSVSPNLGYYFFEDGQEIKKAPTYGVGIGYDFTDRLGIEGSYNVVNTESKIDGTDIDGHLGRLDLVMNFLTEKRFVPYFAIGAGNLSLTPEGGDSESQYFGNWGVGMKYFFNDYMAFRVDGRQIMTSTNINYLTTAGLTFYFGGEKKAKVEEQKPVSQVAPPKDSDRDGVIDDNDQCPNTPAGVKVDNKGCPLDSDKDGVADYLDKCPNTPVGIKVDNNGCPLDSDKDGVTDDKDKCPNTPAGVKVDGNGCPLDSDGDGVTDDKDQCPNTPSGVKVDARGCALDSDGDGVTDDRDQCPDTPGGATVDERGCWVLKGVNFDTAKAVIRASDTKILDDVVGILEKNPSVKIEIDGHTDNVGNAKYNETLSLKRAQAVMEYMVKKGIARDRLTAKGLGLSRPATSNDTPEGRAVNRRVELTPLQ